MTPIVLMTVGLGALVIGAELLVAGSSRIARRLGISPVVIGLTVVAFGTSAPELAVSTGAALRGDSDIALGNVVGSNIFNVLFILGVSALVRPLLVAPSFVRRDVPIMLAVSVLLWLLATDGTIGRTEGIVLVLGIVAYTTMQIAASRGGGGASDATGEADAAGYAGLHVARIVGGLALLVVGSTWFVDGARDVAVRLGVSDLVIGLTLVAAGTSLPELATSVVAVLRGQRDIAVGNIVGSNIFNLLAILGVASVVEAGGVAVDAAALGFDLPVMVIVAALCLPVFLSGATISRAEGALLAAGYATYVVYLGLESVGGPDLGLPPAGALVPLSLGAIGVWTLLAWRRERDGDGPT